MRIRNKDLRDWVALFMLRRGRGNGLIQTVMDIVQTGAYLSMIMIGAERFFGIVIPTWIMLLAPLIPVIQYLLGWADEKKGFWKTEASYVVRHINPAMREMIDDVKEIKRILKDK